MQTVPSCNDPPMIDEVIAIAQEASRKILAVYRSADFEVTIKADNSPLTEADLASNEYICEELKRHFSYPVVAEETPIEYEERKDWKTFWLVDPLDGTQDFVARNDEFTVNIGLVSNRVPVFGLVAIPALGLIYYAEHGKGAYKLENGTTKKIFHDKERPSFICTESRFNASEKTVAFCKKYNIKEVVRFGSSLKLCKMAEGEIDVYPRFVGTKEWDTAAGHCILNEAGCQLVRMQDGGPFLYNKESIVNPSFIASARRYAFTVD